MKVQLGNWTMKWTTRITLVVLLAMSGSYAKMMNLIGMGYAKDFSQDHGAFNSADQFQISYDALVSEFGLGVNLRYHAMYQADHEQLTFLQGLANVGVQSTADNMVLMLSMQAGLGGRSKVMTVYEKDEIGNSLLHEVESESESRMNVYLSYGPRVKVAYLWWIFDRVALAPFLSAEYLYHRLLSEDNVILSRNETKTSIYATGGLCVGF